MQIMMSEDEDEDNDDNELKKTSDNDDDEDDDTLDNEGDNEVDDKEQEPEKGDTADQAATSAYSEGEGVSDESESILRLPYLPISSVPWINPRKGIPLKNIQKELGDMGYKAFKVSTHAVKLLVYFHSYHMSGLIMIMIWNENAQAINVIFYVILYVVFYVIFYVVFD